MVGGPLGDTGLVTRSTPQLATGDPAFDFDLAVYDFSEGTKLESVRTFHLQAVAAERPVALVFGSYT